MKINVKNTEALEEALNAVKARSQVGLIDVQAIESICKQAVDSGKEAVVQIKQYDGEQEIVVDLVLHSQKEKWLVCKDGVFKSIRPKPSGFKSL